jgi:AraC-like DNA-binding protein
VRPIREQVPRTPATSWYQHVRTEDRFPFNWHHHAEHELTLVRTGHGRRFVGDHVASYAPGDLVLVGSDLPHSYQSDDLPAALHEALCVQFRPDFLGSELVRTPEFAAVGRLLDDAARGLHFPVATAREVAAATAGWAALDQATRTVGLLGVLVTLARAHTDGRTGTLATASFAPLLRPDQRARIERVCALVAEGYAEPWTLAAAANVAGMSPAAFSRLFSRGIGRSFSDHLSDVRLAAARQRLRHTDMPVTAIAHRCGFANLANFNRRFRAATGTTPSAYRRLRGPQSAPPLADGAAARSTG